jgi:hypothetical protein
MSPEKIQVLNLQRYKATFSSSAGDDHDGNNGKPSPFKFKFKNTSDSTTMPLETGVNTS